VPLVYYPAAAAHMAAAARAERALTHSEQAEFTPHGIPARTRGAAPEDAPLDAGGGTVEVVSGQMARASPHWQRAFARQHKDHRYYEIVEDTLHPEFAYRYFVIRDAHGAVRALQPFFILDQDILAGVRPHLGPLIEAVRARWPRFLVMKTLMVGCVAGEAHLDAAGDAARAAHAELLAAAIVEHARTLGARLIVLKEFPATYRAALSGFVRRGFTRIPSMPMTRLNIDYASFDDYMRLALNSATRRKLRRKFRATEFEAIELEVTRDIAPHIDEIYPLYLQVYRRSQLHFEKLTKAYFCRLGQAMPDKVRFFVWRRGAKIVAFAECLVHGDTIFAEYIGLDYSVALELHLYHYLYRDLVGWAIVNKCKWFASGGLNYDPKLHLRHRLEPLDLYVSHTSSLVNALMRVALPWLEPTRRDATLKKFPNYSELWDGIPQSDANDGVEAPAPGATFTEAAMNS
jgi:predicted N-acyltransferase